MKNAYSIIKKIFRKSLNISFRIYRLLFTKHIKLYVNDIFFQENGKNFNRMDIIVRYLAIENYYNKNDFGFNLYEKMQNLRINQKNYGKISLDKFKNLIKSYETDGYDCHSEIELDKNLFLVDGSHRMALALYHNIDTIFCKMRPYSVPVKYGIEWFIEHDFSLDEVKIIQTKYHNIHNQIIEPFICILWPPVQVYFDDIMEKLALMERVVAYQDFIYDDVNFIALVKGVYAVDDIAAWKVDKKIEYMNRNKSGFGGGVQKVRLVFLQIEDPCFRLKTNNHTLSVRCEELKRIIRNAYKNKIENYYFDIIIHIGDNYYQNNCMRKLFILNIKDK